ncbi:MAG TPA: adenosine deaminase, partial [Terriglobales bacterium]|nr:adenosine deaminase [Terriglobales bacterium]
HKDFGEFLLAFRDITFWLRDPEDYALVLRRMMRSLAEQNVRHAEVYISVGVIHWRSQSFGEIFAALDQARRQSERETGISLYWIFDAVRHFGVEAAERVVEEALRYRDHNVIAIGIGGDERRGPAEWFRDLYSRAAAAGLRLTAHAGESCGPESITAALDLLKAQRIGHGLSAQHDPALLDRLRREQVPIEVCISSNLRTGCCPRLADHPVRRYFDAGLNVVLNSDDPPMFGTTLSREYQLAQDAFGFSDHELRRLAENSFRASFLPEDRKRALLAELKVAGSHEGHKGSTKDR